ncbi:MAG: tRNA pseudouridine(38-40) synthase TruA [Clostridia bacterium]
MRNIKLTISYDGTAYHGWQIQQNANTVQEELTKVCERIFNEKISLNGCSRTDTGVHANEFCLNFFTSSSMNVEKIQSAINALAPADISVSDVQEKNLDFHARFDCVGKEYIYKIHIGKTRNPFCFAYSLHYPYAFDVAALNEVCKKFVGTHDFSAFCASGSTVNDKTRTIYACWLEQEGDMAIFHVRGDGFLYNMVRILVGTLLYVARGKIDADEIEDIIKSKKRERAGITASSHGLYLNKVFYDKEGLLDEKQGD